MKRITRRARPVARAAVGATEAARHNARRVWLAMLGTVPMAGDAVKRTVKRELTPRYRAYVAEGRAVESRMIRSVGERIDRGVAMGRDAVAVVRETAAETSDRVLRTLRVPVPRRGRRDVVASLLGRIDGLEAAVRDLAVSR